MWLINIGNWMHGRIQNAWLGAMEVKLWGAGIGAYPTLSERGIGMGNTFFTWNGVFWWILNGIFATAVARKMLNFLREVMIWWQMYNSCVQCSFGRDLTYCNHRWLRQYCTDAGTFEIWGGQFKLASSSLQILRETDRVIYAYNNCHVMSLNFGK